MLIEEFEDLTSGTWKSNFTLNEFGGDLTPWWVGGLRRGSDRCEGWWVAEAAGKGSCEVNNLPPPRLWRNGKVVVVVVVTAFLVFSWLVSTSSGVLLLLLLPRPSRLLWGRTPFYHSTLPLPLHQSSTTPPVFYHSAQLLPLHQTFIAPQTITLLFPTSSYSRIQAYSIYLHDKSIYYKPQFVYDIYTVRCARSVKIIRSC